VKPGDLVKWRDPVSGHSSPPLYGVAVEHLKTGWVSIYWFADDMPENPTREPSMHLELLNEYR
jgi:hypothetical protein